MRALAASPRRTPDLRLRYLRTRDGQRIAYAVEGAQHGAPVVVLHGGPGGASQAAALRLFDLARCRVVLVDQRSAGRSGPLGRVVHNNTAALIRDLEALRVELGITRWGVFGGSWGAALAIAYAGRHPDAVTGVVLRGLFLTSTREIRGLFIGSRKRAPRAWQRLMRAAQCTHVARLPARCHAALRAGAPAVRQRAVARAWHHYERAVLASASDPRRMSRRLPARGKVDPRALVARYRVQSHYLRHRCWLGTPRLLALARHAAAAGVGFSAVHGTRDPVCPRDNLRRFARAVPDARVHLVRAGHLTCDVALHRAVAAELAYRFTPSLDEARDTREAA